MDTSHYHLQARRPCRGRYPPQRKSTKLYDGVLVQDSPPLSDSTSLPTFRTAPASILTPPGVPSGQDHQGASSKSRCVPWESRPSLESPTDSSPSPRRRSRRGRQSMSLTTQSESVPVVETRRSGTTGPEMVRSCSEGCRLVDDDVGPGGAAVDRALRGPSVGPPSRCGPSIRQILDVGE